MMRSCNKIDALMVDDIHECRGSGRYRNRQIKHIGVDFHCTSALPYGVM